MSTPTRERQEWTPERVALVGRNLGIVIGLGILIGAFAIAVNLYYVAALIGAAMLVILVASQFELALVVYALVAFVPWGRTPDLTMGGSGVGKGVYVSEMVLGFLLAVWIGRYLLRALPSDRPRTGFHVPLALYLCYAVLNLVNSYIFWDPHVSRQYQHFEVNLAELGLRFLSAGAFAMVATSISNRKWLTWITVMMCIPALYSLTNAALGTKIPMQAPWWPFLLLLPVGYCWEAVMDPQRRWYLRAAGLLITSVAVSIVLFRGIAWVSGWLALAVAIGTITLIRKPRAFAVGTALVALLALASWPFLHENVIKESETGGDYARFALLRGGIRYATTFPLGVGIGNYRTYNAFYYGEKWGTTAYTSAHGTYSQHLAEMGFVGFVLLCAILLMGFLWMLRSYWKMPRGPSRRFVLAALGHTAGISAAAIVGDYIIPTYHNGGLTTFSVTVYSWLIWGLAVAHVRISSRETDGPERSDR